MPEDPDIARIQGAHELGLAFVRSIILLNSGAFAVLLAYMASATSDALIIFEIGGLQTAMYSFLVGILSILLALIVSYFYTALNFESRVRAWLDNKVIPANVFLALISLSVFGYGVRTLIESANVQ